MSILSLKISNTTIRKASLTVHILSMTMRKSIYIIIVNTTLTEVVSVSVWGVLIAKYLQNHDDEVLLNSLKKYIKYVQNNLVCIETGEVFNDYNYDNSFTRLYNYPWFSLFYIELYKLFRDKNMLEIAYKIMYFFTTKAVSIFMLLKCRL